MTPEAKQSGSDFLPGGPKPASTEWKLEDFEYIRSLVREKSAIVLEESKSYFAEARLDALARREEIASAAELVARLKLGGSDGLRQKAVEAMMQNETSFFRDARPFEELRRSILPNLIRSREPTRRLKVWSAACSSGQEPYSMALLLREHFPALARWDVSILASDLSTEMVDRAKQGRYNQGEVNRGLPSSLLVKYFHRDGLEWTIDEGIRHAVEFRPINLIGPWSIPASFDLILLRNVLIYFGLDQRKAILSKIARALAPDGYLWLGSGESMLNINDQFQRLEPECGSLYRLRPR